jgi:hypothetical protein
MICWDRLVAHHLRARKPSDLLLLGNGEYRFFLAFHFKPRGRNKLTSKRAPYFFTHKKRFDSFQNALPR